MTTYEINFCLVGSEMCIRDRAEMAMQVNLARQAPLRVPRLQREVKGILG